jgi:hypothetical protein
MRKTKNQVKINNLAESNLKGKHHFKNFIVTSKYSFKKKKYSNFINLSFCFGKN